MAATFEFVGKLKKIEKDTEKLKAFDEKKGEKQGDSYTFQKFRFKAVNGNNSHIMEVNDVFFYTNSDGSVDANKMKIYARSKTDGGAKSQQLEVAFADRTNPEVLAKIAYFSKFGINLNKPGEEKNASNDHEYLFKGDFMNALRKLMDNPNFTSRRVHIKGTMDIRYDESTGIFYRTFAPSRVWFANDDEPDMMKLSIDLIYGPGAVEEDGDILRVNCYHRYYDKNYRKDSCKGQATCPIQFVVRDKQYFDSVRRRFSNFPDECTFAKLDATLDVINGTEMVPIRYEDLSEDARENIDFGFTTLEYEIREAGGTVYGDRVTELRFRGTRNVQGTAYEAEDLLPPRHDGADEADNTSSGLSAEKKADDEDFDLFGDL